MTFPIYPRSYNLVDDTCQAVNQYFRCHITPDRVKACHPLHSKKIFFSGIIIKFIYFSDKDKMYSRRKMFGQQTWNNRKLNITKRLPKFDLEIKKPCDERGIITTTRNCKVRIFCKKPDGLVSFCGFD